ncbi:MAG TPA: hypothetical protein VNG71_00960 [Pyrinomonadaceae bacterium]|nr:hypothetical protein [Pyrinomonadaceae bacterium]
MQIIHRLTKRIILALLIVGGIVIIAIVVTIASWLTGSSKKASQQSAAKMQEGAVFGKTTNQQGCIDEGLTRGFKLGVFDFEAQGANEDFVLGCLPASASSPGFCDGVPSGVKNIFVDWTKAKCEKIEMPGTICTGIYDQQIRFCEN